MPARPPPWTAWSAVWLSTLGSSLVAVLVLALLSTRVAEDSLTQALETHLSAQVSLVSRSARALPVEVMSQLSGAHSAAGLDQDLAGLRDAGGLHGLALLGPAGDVMGEGGAWLPGRAESDLIARASAGEPVTGPLYRAEGGALFLTAYAPLQDHPGWVVAIEGSAASLGAVDRLEQTQLVAGAAVVLLSGLLGALLAAVVARPLRRLDAELSQLSPGDDPARITPGGPREVHAVARAVAALLGEIQARDATITQAHLRELDQVARISAEIAHEVRNPLNAMALSTFRLAELDDRERRAEVAARLRGQIEGLDGIVSRLVDITRPLLPQPRALDLAGLARDVAAELGIDLDAPATAPVHGDPLLLTEVLRNLLLNAQQAGAERVTLIQDGEAITLRDDGSGVPEAQVDELFRWFHTTRAQGSGLGLPLSRRMVEAHGGRLDLVEAQPATFRLILPDPNHPGTSP